MQFAAHEEERDTEAAKVAARKAYIKNAGIYQNAVKNGDIPPDASPFFMKVWQDMDGSAKADEFNRDLLTALATGPLAQSTNQEESSSLIDTFKSNWMKANGVEKQSTDFVFGFGAKANGYEQNARRFQTERVSNNIAAAADEALGANVSGILEEITTLDLNPSAIGEGINLQKEKALLAGMTPQNINKTILESVATAAQEKLDTTILDVLDHVNTGSGKLGSTGEAKRVKEAVKTAIYRELQQRDSWEYTQEQRKKTKIVLTANASIGATMLANLQAGKPTTIAQVQKELDAIIATGDWSHAEAIKGAVIKSQKEEELPENEVVKNELYIATFRDREVNPKRLTKAFESGDINLKTYDDLIHEHRANEEFLSSKDEEDEKRKRKAGTDPAFSRAGASLGRIFGGDLAVSVFEVQVLRSQAEAQYWTSVSRWAKANPQATETEKIEFATKTLNVVVEQFRSELGKFAGTVKGIINTAPGVKGGEVSPIGVNRYQSVFKSPEDFEAAIDEEIHNPGKSRLAQKATELGMSVADLIQQEQSLQ
jgi:hypothetical protein